ncbi:hypothetical protein AUR64_18095 [Haloprofundus marisrubri]|uniref:Uncharacterized protein n=1 Tax=Haloprofundus marisrubri TaxID=1514971 RepID=A0A0W1R595_9EURY|nr:hypothetical protein [Haloprofundus marisrubri]KTG08585.1 hypothetical protein AUR64_18095 [Haloprofundus marisrubri]
MTDPSDRPLSDFVKRWAVLIAVVVGVALIVRILTGFPPVPWPLIIAYGSVPLLTISTGGIVGIAFKRHVFGDLSDPTHRLVTVVVSISSMLLMFVVSLQLFDWLFHALGVLSG